MDDSRWCVLAPMPRIAITVFQIHSHGLRAPCLCVLDSAPRTGLARCARTPVSLGIQSERHPAGDEFNLRCQKLPRNFRQRDCRSCPEGAGSRYRAPHGGGPGHGRGGNRSSALASRLPHGVPGGLHGKETRRATRCVQLQGSAEPAANDVVRFEVDSDVGAPELITAWDRFVPQPDASPFCIDSSPA